MEDSKKIKFDDKFGAVVETTPDTIIIIDEDNIVIFCNKNVVNTFGYTPGELINRDMSIIIPPEFRERHLQGMKRFVESGQPKLIGKTIEITGLRKDGTIIPIELSLSFWKEDKKTYFSSIIRDISERNKILQELELLQSITQAINESPDFDSAIKITIRKVCELTGWEYGEAWIPNENKTELTLNSWFTKDDKFEIIAKESKHWKLKPGEGIPGRAFNNVVEWNPDVSQSPTDRFPRAGIVNKTGLKAGLGIPITCDNEVLASLAFYMTEEREVDERLIKVITSVAGQLGSVLKKKKSEEELRILNSELERRVQERTKALDEKNNELISQIERIHFILEAMPQKVWTARKDGNVDYCNEKWLDYTGLSLEELRNWGWKKIIHPEDWEKNVRIWQRSIDSGKDFQIEHRFLRKDGEYRWHLSRGLAYKDPIGNIIMWIGTNTDIHDQKIVLENLARNKEELSQKNKELTRINNDLDSFIYTASHDLKAPVSNIEGLILALADSFSKETSEKEEVNSLMNMIGFSINKFKGTLVDLTDITKIQRNMEEEISEIDIYEITEDIKLGMGEEIEKSGADISIDAKACPTIKFSKAHIASVIYNLLSNAIKYRDRARNLKITIRTDRINNYTLLEIRDNGLGIAQENKDKIFGMFKRFHDHVEGTGVGLYIVKKIVENSGGKIEVESEIGKGSVFRVYFKIS